MRDENGFKCHTQSESHVRQMLVVGEDPKKAIAAYSNQFLSDFLKLLRTAHGEKKIMINHFYQEFIAHKEHIHMNSTKWPSLTELAKHLGREGICRVEETDKGLTIAWIDNSPEALRRQDAIRKKERQDRGDEELEQKLIREQIAKAKLEAIAAGRGDEDEIHDESRALQRSEDGQKIKLSFETKNTAKLVSTPASETPEKTTPPTDAPASEIATVESTTVVESEPQPGLSKMSLSMGSSKPKNVFAAKKNAFSSKKTTPKEQPKRPMSEAERIMKEEIERKRPRSDGQQGGFKKQRVF
jgi:DNA/RNA-binding protein KIN17